MRIIPTFKKCKICKVDLMIDEYHYNEPKDTYASTCKDCLSKKVSKTGRSNRNKFVKSTWLNSTIQLSDRKVVTNKVKDSDIQQIIDEGYGFILRNFEQKGLSIL